MMYSTPGIALEPPVELRNPPVLNVKTEQVEGILDKLDQYWQRFAPHFQRREQREWGVKYISGRFSGRFMEGKKYFTNAIARRVGEKNERAMQNFVGASPWDGHAVLMEHQLTAEETSGTSRGLCYNEWQWFSAQRN